MVDSKVYEMVSTAGTSVKLAKVRPAMGKDCIYYVETDVESQTNYICRLHFEQNEQGLHIIENCWRRIYTMLESDVVAIQLDNDTFQRVDGDYDGQHRGCGEHDDNPRPYELHVLDGNCNLLKLRAKSRDNCEQVACKNMSCNEKLR